MGATPRTPTPKSLYHTEFFPASSVFNMRLLWHFLFFTFGSHRFSIKGRIYPAILPAESKKVAGLVCTTQPAASTLHQTLACLCSYAD